MLPTTAQKKLRVLAFVPASCEKRRYRERPAKVRVSDEIRLDDDLRSSAASIRDDDGRAVTGDFERWARGGCRPLSIFAHYVVRAAKHGADEQSILAIVHRLESFVRAVFRKYGTQRRAA